MLMEFGKAGYLAKAKSQPEKVKQVLEKIRIHGLVPAIRAVRGKLDQPIPLGYYNVGKAIEAQGSGHTAQGMEGFRIGDRVANNGPHAGVVCVPGNLCVRVPDKVSDEEAPFTVLAAIGRLDVLSLITYISKVADGYKKAK
jgi:NADPH:quinone reductase-like Zn-dependent oxidoreductase